VSLAFPSCARAKTDFSSSSSISSSAEASEVWDTVDSWLPADFDDWDFRELKVLSGFIVTLAS